MDNLVNDLLPRVKANLILAHDLDDELLCGIIRSAVDYAISYQKREKLWEGIPPATVQAIVMLASHWYESRDGGTGGFFADTALAAQNVTAAVQRLLGINKEYWHT